MHVACVNHRFALKPIDLGLRFVPEAPGNQSTSLGLVKSEPKSPNIKGGKAKVAPVSWNAQFVIGTSWNTSPIISLYCLSKLSIRGSIQKV